MIIMPGSWIKFNNKIFHLRGKPLLISIYHLINQIKRELKVHVDNQVYRDEKANGELQDIPVEMISTQAKKAKLELMEDQGT